MDGEVLNMSEWTTTLLAQTSSGGAVQTVWDFAIKGGWMMLPIILCSLVALTIAIERALMLARNRVIPPDFVSGLRDALKQNGEPKAALAYCAKDPSPLAEVFMAVVKRLSAPAERIERAVADAGARLMLRLRKRMRALSVIASIAPLLGLLGTIIGMIRAFRTVAGTASALGDTELLAQGIYEALITTAAGLAVAIPVLIAYHWLTGRIELRVAEMDLLVDDFLEEHRAKQPQPVVHAASRLREAVEPAAAAVATDSAAGGSDGNGNGDGAVDESTHETAALGGS